MLLRDLSTAARSGPEHAPRRGAAAMEYLFVISLILVVVLTGVGYLGKSTKEKADRSTNTIKQALTR